MPKTTAVHPSKKVLSIVNADSHMSVFVMNTVTHILEQKNVGPCINVDKDGFGRGMAYHKQNVIRCMDAQPLPSELNMHDYKICQSGAVYELQDALVIFNTQEDSTNYNDEAHMAFFPFHYTFGGKESVIKSDTKKFETNKPIHLFARISKQDPFTYCGRLSPHYTKPLMTATGPTWKFTMTDLPNPPPQEFLQFLNDVYDVAPLPTTTT